MITSDSFHTVDVYTVSDLLTHNGEVPYYDVLTNHSYYDSSLTDETVEEFLYKTYKNFGESVLCYVYLRKSVVYDTDMSVLEFSEDFSHKIYYVNSHLCVDI